MRRDERGSIVITALLVGVVLAVLGGSLMQGAFADLRQGEVSQSTNRSLQAAEAGVNDYVAKLTENHLYYAHQVHPAESTRATVPGGVRFAAGDEWDGSMTWTYPDGRDGGFALGDGYQYSLQVFAPTAERPTVRILATGMRVGDDATAHTLEAFVRAASIADFQMISNAEIIYGATAVTNGKVYAGNGSNVVHRGLANANLYAEGGVWGNKVGTGASAVYSGVPTFGAGAQGYDGLHGTIRAQIPEAIDFTDFIDSIGDVQRAAVAGGVSLDDTADAAWWLHFLANGTIEVRSCPTVDLTAQTPDYSTDPPSPPIPPPPPACGAPTYRDVPRNGAVYVDQDAIVSGIVKGKVTVASPGNVIVGEDITYGENGTDVLGLMAKDDILVPSWAPKDLEWWSATLAIENQWKSASKFVAAEASHDVIHYYGSTATNLGGGMNQFRERFYEYDKNLLFLQPPYFPVLEDAYTIELLREVP